MIRFEIEVETDASPEEVLAAIKKALAEQDWPHVNEIKVEIEEES